jgi:hypothetical protein
MVTASRAVFQFDWTYRIMKKERGKEDQVSFPFERLRTISVRKLDQPLRDAKKYGDRLRKEPLALPLLPIMSSALRGTP